MSLSKFKVTLVFILFSSNAFATFTEKECLDSEFKVEVGHKDKMTFGIAKTKLGIKKTKCEIIVTHEKLKFVKNQWKIDVCREPVHIKSGDKGVEVLKKKGRCPNKNAADFCEALVTIREVIQDDGLIFAPGEKENLSTDHGRVYCAYQLVGGYLGDDRIYSRYAPSTKPMVDSTPAPSLMPVESSPSVDPTPPEEKNVEEGSF